MNLFPIGISMTPKRTPPCMIQYIQPVFFQLFPKCFLTFFAMTRSILEISSRIHSFDMPRITPDVFQSVLIISNPTSSFFSHNSRRVTKIMPFPGKFCIPFSSVCIASGYFGCHRHCTCWCS